MKIIFIFSVIAFISTLLPEPYTLNPIPCSYAEIPRLINYQGRLTDSGGKPLDGAYKLNFKIYNSAGALLWQGTHNSVLVQKGVFSVLLGDASDAPYNFAQLAFDEPYFLEIKVCKLEGANEICEVLSPRQQITSAAYAIRAGEADNAIQAQNANTVGNVGLNTTPVANKILPLDSSGKLPSGEGLLSNNLVITTGIINNGETIPLPSGFREDQCKWIVSYANTQGVQSAAWDNWLWVKCYTTGRVVNCATGSAGPGGGPYPTDANYMVICSK